MRTPFVWIRLSPSSLLVLCACCALWAAPVTVRAATEPLESTRTVAKRSVSSATGAVSNDSTEQVPERLRDKRLLMLLAAGCVVGLIASCSRASAPEIRFRLLHKPKKTPLPVLVPPGPPPRLIPGESPNATRARTARAEVSRQKPAGARPTGLVDYIAAFGDPAKANVDYVLVPGDDPEDTTDPSEASHASDTSDGSCCQS
jgi:hypothetical protein